MARIPPSNVAPTDTTAWRTRRSSFFTCSRCVWLHSRAVAEYGLMRNVGCRANCVKPRVKPHQQMSDLRCGKSHREMGSCRCRTACCGARGLRPWYIAARRAGGLAGCPLPRISLDVSPRFVAATPFWPCLCCIVQCAGTSLREVLIDWAHDAGWSGAIVEYCRSRSFTNVSPLLHACVCAWARACVCCVIYTPRATQLTTGQTLVVAGMCLCCVWLRPSREAKCAHSLRQNLGERTGRWCLLLLLCLWGRQRESGSSGLGSFLFHDPDGSIM